MGKHLHKGIVAAFFALAVILIIQSAPVAHWIAARQALMQIAPR
jgi:hypothetical protein